MNEKLETLMALTDMQRQFELSKLKRIALARDAICHEIQNLTLLSTCEFNDELSVFAAKTYGAEQKFEKWCNHRKAELNRQLALVAVDYQEQMVQAQRAVGRDDVIRKIKEKNSEEKLIKARRA